MIFNNFSNKMSKNILIRTSYNLDVQVLAQSQKRKREKESKQQSFTLNRN